MVRVSNRATDAAIAWRVRDALATHPLLGGAATALNAAANGVALAFTDADPVGTAGEWDVVLAGDVFYDRALAARVLPWLAELRRRGARVLVGDPGRAYLPKTGLFRLAQYEVPVTRALEDAEVKRTTVWELT